MKAIYEPKEFADLIKDLSMSFDGIALYCLSTLKEYTYSFNVPFLNCPKKITYYPMAADDIRFKLPITAALATSLRRALKYYTNHLTFYIKNISSSEWTHFCVRFNNVNEEEAAIFKRKIKKAQQYPDNELGEEFNTLKDLLYVDKCNDYIEYSIDAFDGSSPIILNTGIYEAYYTLYGLESNHCFIDIIVDYIRIIE